MNDRPICTRTHSDTRAKRVIHCLTHLIRLLSAFKSPKCMKNQREFSLTIGATVSESHCERIRATVCCHEGERMWMMRKRKLTPVRYRGRLLGHRDKNRRNSENWFGTVHTSLYRRMDGDGGGCRGTTSRVMEP